MVRVGIDASNVRAGGGVTYLTNLIVHARPADHGISTVVVWGGRAILSRLPDRPWLQKIHEIALDGGLLSRLRWQSSRLAALANVDCDVLFVPGGTYVGRFRPFVTMSQNMLPFAKEERKRYGWSRVRVRLALLALAQARTFLRADGLIFLSEAARETIGAQLDLRRVRTTQIPHGVDPSFLTPPRPQDPARSFTTERPFRWLYVSIVDAYKHQWNVALAVAALSRRGLPVRLDLVGPAYPPALRRLRRTLDRLGVDGQCIHYYGGASPADLPAIYRSADAFVFGSTCENMPIILLEAMASGLPIVSSDRRVMREVLGDGGLYAEPLDPSDLERAMAELMTRPDLRTAYAHRAFARAQGYDWSRTAAETFTFLRTTVEAADVRSGPGFLHR